jgi:anti-sigma factor RsiW
MKCHLFRLLIQRYYDGELDPAERSEYESHRRRCSACRALDSRFAVLVDALDHAPSFEPSADFNRRVLSRIDVASFRVNPARAAFRAIGRALSAVPIPLRNAGIVTAICAGFIAVYKPLLDYMITTIGHGAEALWSGMLFVQELGGRIAALVRGVSAAQSYEVAGQTLFRAFHHILSELNPVQAVVAIASLVFVAVVIRRMLGAARRKGETDVCIL